MRQALLAGGAAALVLVGLVVGTVELLGAAAGPETQVLTALKATEDDGLSIPVAGGTLRSGEHFFERIVVEVDPEGRAKAVSTLDFEGRFTRSAKGPQTKVSSLGREVSVWVRKGGGWSPEGSAAPRLTGVVAALERRRQALENADVASLARLWGRPEAEVRADPEIAELVRMRHRRYDARAWYIRSEREEVRVTEEYRLQGDLPDRPVDELERRSLVIREVDGEFSFPSGVL